jgi:hypothetical protein
LPFADDMLLVADKERELERILGTVKEYCEKWRLKVNFSYVKVMVVSKGDEKVAKVKYAEEMCQSLCLSGYCLLSNGNQK